MKDTLQKILDLEKQIEKLKSEFTNNLTWAINDYVRVCQAFEVEGDFPNSSFSFTWSPANINEIKIYWRETYGDGFTGSFWFPVDLLNKENLAEFHQSLRDKKKAQESAEEKQLEESEKAEFERLKLKFGVDKNSDAK